MFISTLGCVITGRPDVQAAHIRIGNGGGVGLKPSDEYCIPLCVDQHRRQGEIGEVRFWYPFGGHEKASVLARKLYENSGDEDTCRQLIAEFRNGMETN